MVLKDIGKFEKQNPDIVANVFVYESGNEENCPLRISKLNRKLSVNILLLEDKRHVLINE